MKASIIALGAAAAVSAQSNGTVPWTTSTVYATSVYTITSCAPTVTNCPAKIGKVTTDIISLYTTYCPVSATETSAGVSYTPAPSVPAGPYTTSTVYSTETLTISKCHPDITNCPYTTAPVTTVRSYPVSTTVCPVTTPVGTGKPSGSVVPPPSHPSVPGAPVSSAPVPPPYSPSKPAGIISTITISTCVPTTYTSVITVTPSAKSTPASPVGTITPSGVPSKSNTTTTVQFTGAASATKAGGLLMAVGLVAALL